MNGSPYIFTNNLSELPTPDDFILNIKCNIVTTSDLFSVYEKEGIFPSYFGRNWDALLDCLRDFSWINQKRIIITHNDLPLANCEAELRIYLDILETAVVDWRKIRQGPFVESSQKISFVDHELIVLFPVVNEASVNHILTQKR